PIFIRSDEVDGLDAAGRADPAWCALAAGLDCAKLHRETRLLQHVDGVVEHHHAAVSDKTIARRERLVIERRIKQRARKISAKRTTDLHRAHRPARQGAAADVVDDLAQGEAKCSLE